MTNFYDTLGLLAEALGVEPQYTDNWGKVHRTSPKMAEHILETKGISIRRDLMNLNPQVLVVSVDVLPDSVPVFLTSAPAGNDCTTVPARVTITDEQDLTRADHWTFEQSSVPLAVDEKTGLLTLSLPFPRDLEIGLYRVRVNCTVRCTAEQAECLWLVCPEQTYVPPELKSQQKLAGVGLALYGVRSADNWGVGDFHDLEGIIDWASDTLRVDFVGLNPLHALFNRRPNNHSPYLPSSRLFHNFIYLYVPATDGFAECAKAHAMVASTATQERIRQLREDSQVNYEGVAALKEEILREVFASFMDSHGNPERVTAAWEAFCQYRKSQGVYLDRYATFCALNDHFRSVLPTAPTWREWPENFHNPASEAVRTFRQEHEEPVLFWMYVQWQLDVQLQRAQRYALERGMRVGLYLDEALAVDRNGADCWAWPEFYHSGFTVGAPPDAFAPDGQEWGFPPPDRDRHRASGYQLFLKQLEVSCRHAGALRIDHVMQLYHLFWIPPGGKPADGVYVKDYEEDLLSVLALASQQAQTVIVGEDLGTVPLDFRDRLMAKGVLSYRLFYFERHSDKSLLSHHEYPRSAMVSITTHDLPTLVGFWSALDIDTRRDMGMLEPEAERTFREERTQHKAKIIEKLVQEGFLAAHVAHAAWESPVPTEELHDAVLRFLFSTPSAMVMINQEDVFLDARQQNFPGTTWERPNWITKMLYSVEDLETHPEARRLSTKFMNLLQEVGRGAPRGNAGKELD